MRISYRNLISASKCYVLLLCKTLRLNMFEYNGALEALSTCSFGSYHRPNPKVPQLSSTCCRIDISPWHCCLEASRYLNVSPQDIANLLGSSHRILCKQECSLRWVGEFDGMQFHSRSCSSFCSPPRMFCWRSFWRKNIYSIGSSGTFVRLLGNFYPQTRISQACWCHHLKKLRDKHETRPFIVIFQTLFLPQTIFTGQQCALSYCLRQYWTFWFTGSFSVHLSWEQTSSDGPPPRL